MKKLLIVLGLVAIAGCTSAQQSKEEAVFKLIIKGECLLAAAQSTELAVQDLCPGDLATRAKCPALGTLLADLAAKVQKCNAQ